MKRYYIYLKYKFPFGNNDFFLDADTFEEALKLTSKTINQMKMPPECLLVEFRDKEKDTSLLDNFFKK